MLSRTASMLCVDGRPNCLRSLTDPVPLDFLTIPIAVHVWVIPTCAFLRILLGGLKKVDVKVTEIFTYYAVEPTFPNQFVINNLHNFKKID